jgi:hypothetical protein
MSEHESVQAYGRKKLDSSTFVGGKISAWPACFYALAVIREQRKFCFIKVLMAICLQHNFPITVFLLKEATDINHRALQYT